MKISKEDILLLKNLYKQEAITQLQSLTIKCIIDRELSKDGEQIIRRRLKRLLENELLAEGFKSKNSKTYYVTKIGMELINNLKGE